jgi:hypothetical protein
MTNAHTGYHPATQIDINGSLVEVDLEIVEFVRWLNALPGVSTYTSCQGGGCSVDAFVHFMYERGIRDIHRAVYRRLRHSHSTGARELSIGVSEDGNPSGLQPRAVPDSSLTM